MLQFTYQITKEAVKMMNNMMNMKNMNNMFYFYYFETGCPPDVVSKA